MPLDVRIHPDLVWDYADPPRDPMWRLQRLTDAFRRMDAIARPSRSSMRTEPGCA